jgi:hypothetical protein
VGVVVVFPEWGPERRNLSARVNPGTFEPGCEVEQAATYYYYVWSVAHAFRALGARAWTDQRREVAWAEELARELVAQQRVAGTWTNPIGASKEGDPRVATPPASGALVLRACQGRANCRPRCWLDDPPPRPSPIRGEGTGRLSPSSWGRVGVGEERSSRRFLDTLSAERRSDPESARAPGSGGDLRSRFGGVGLRSDDGDRDIAPRCRPTLAARARRLGLLHRALRMDARPRIDGLLADRAAPSLRTGRDGGMEVLRVHEDGPADGVEGAGAGSLGCLFAIGG